MNDDQRHRGDTHDTIIATFEFAAVRHCEGFEFFYIFCIYRLIVCIMLLVCFIIVYLPEEEDPSGSKHCIC